jgi:hypothetical protein
MTTTSTMLDVAYGDLVFTEETHETACEFISSCDKVALFRATSTLPCAHRAMLLCLPHTEWLRGAYEPGSILVCQLCDGGPRGRLLSLTPLGGQ